jgi:hypothetical protein
LGGGEGGKEIYEMLIPEIRSIKKNSFVLNVVGVE